MFSSSHTKIKAMVSQLQESQRQMSDALAMCKSAMAANDPVMVSDYSLKLEPDFRDARCILKEKEVGMSSRDKPKNKFYMIDCFNRKQSPMYSVIKLMNQISSRTLLIDLVKLHWALTTRLAKLLSQNVRLTHSMQRLIRLVIHAVHSLSHPT